MFVITAGLLAIVCGVLIAIGCWLPPRADGVTVDAVRRRLTYERYCRTMESQWPARAEVAVDRELVRARLRAIAPPRGFVSTFVPRVPVTCHDDDLGLG
ncbi:hypothetical protein [Nocardia nova]|uniref:hypothetical protein n=1 Tax=Nocardia nova TaxID=37330 RepID=UPI0033F611C0